MLQLTFNPRFNRLSKNPTLISLLLLLLQSGPPWREVLVRNFEKNPYEVQVSCFVGVVKMFSPLGGTNSRTTH